ncbi:hypothetical protein Ancab_007385 [Ancistrocladus abbreviatus]
MILNPRRLNSHDSIPLANYLTQLSPSNYFANAESINPRCYAIAHHLPLTLFHPHITFPFSLLITFPFSLALSLSPIHHLSLSTPNGLNRRKENNGGFVIIFQQIHLSVRVVSSLRLLHFLPFQPQPITTNQEKKKRVQFALHIQPPQSTLLFMVFHKTHRFLLEKPL